jgi:hypothetical protein
MERENQSRQTMRIISMRAIATAAAALIALTTISLQPVAAGWRHGNDAAALAVFGAVLGTIAAVVAAEQHREQPVFVPASPYPYDREYDGYAYRWHGHGHGWHHEER